MVVWQRCHHKPAERLEAAAEGGHCRGHCSQATCDLADEPTGNLDSASSKILGYLKIWHREGRTVILITHDTLGLQNKLKRVVRIMDGKIESDVVSHSEEVQEETE